MTLTQLLILGLANFAMAYYIASGEVAEPIRTPIQRKLRAATIRQAHAVADKKAGLKGPKLKLGWFRWLSKMIVPEDIGDSACRYCVGQYSAFVLYGVTIGGFPWTWGWWGWIGAVAINGFHILPLTLTYLDLDGDLTVRQDIVDQ